MEAEVVQEYLLSILRTKFSIREFDPIPGEKLTNKCWDINRPVNVRDYVSPREFVAYYSISEKEALYIVCAGAIDISASIDFACPNFADKLRKFVANCIRFHREDIKARVESTKNNPWKNPWKTSP